MVDGTILYEVQAETDAYVSVMVSKDKKMGDDDGINCVMTDDHVAISHGFNPTYYTDYHRLDNVTDVEIARLDGKLNCRYRIPLIWSITHIIPGRPPTNVVKTFDRTEKWHLFVAWGKVYEGSSIMEQHLEYPVVSDQQIDFLKTDINTGRMIPIEVSMHGTLAIIAWFLLVGFLEIIARYYKKALSKNCCGIAAWLQLHRTVSFVVFLLSAGSIVAIFLYMKEWKEHATLHGIFGLVAVGLGLIQIVLGLCRPSPQAKARPFFNWHHRISGIVAYICAVVSIFLGVNMHLFSNSFNIAETVIFAVWVVFHVTFNLVLQFIEFRRQANSIKIDSTVPDGSQLKLQDPDQKKPSYTADLILLAIYGACVLGLLAACLVFMFME